MMSLQCSRRINKANELTNVVDFSMIEIQTGTLEEQIIRLLQKTYPITTHDLLASLQVSERLLNRAIKKLQVQGIVAVEPLPDTTYLRLLRFDISFVAKKRQKKFIKHRRGQQRQSFDHDEYDDSNMYQ